MATSANKRCTILIAKAPITVQMTLNIDVALADRN